MYIYICTYIRDLLFTVLSACIGIWLPVDTRTRRLACSSLSEQFYHGSLCLSLSPSPSASLSLSLRESQSCVTVQRVVPPSLSRGSRHASLPVGLIRSSICARANRTTARRLSFQQRHVLSLFQRSVLYPWSPYLSFREIDVTGAIYEQCSIWASVIQITECHLSRQC